MMRHTSYVCCLQCEFGWDSSLSFGPAMDLSSCLWPLGRMLAQSKDSCSLPEPPTCQQPCSAPNQGVAFRFDVCCPLEISETAAWLSGQTHCMCSQRQFTVQCLYFDVFLYRASSKVLDVSNL